MYAIYELTDPERVVEDISDIDTTIHGSVVDKRHIESRERVGWLTQGATLVCRPTSCTRCHSLRTRDTQDPR